ncbi:MAG: polyprenyl synthetase family protein [Actinobacteria bacterium]|nr:polyprenyl synthetase family protein [Actinomycetota bacterium]
MVNDARGTLLAVRETVQSELTSYLTLQREYLSGIGSELIPVCDALESFLLEGGKRLRPLFAYAGFAATGKVATAADIRAFTSLELLQACALIHDDLMDRSDTRRGKPAIHRHFENLHQQEAMSGLADQFGEAAAVLLGDLALVWSDHLLHTSGVENSALLSALKVHDEMRIELMAGQYLDVREAGERSPSVDRSLRIARYKSGKYTIERPLHLGASLAITDEAERKDLTNILSAYGLPLGEAFQLRDDMLGIFDDMLGIFGDPSVTGKPAGDDIREGKRTVLMAMTLERADQASAAKITAALGREDLTADQIEEIRALITATGAVKVVEDLIEGLLSNALTAANSDEIDPSARELLIELATSATRRSH